MINATEKEIYWIAGLLEGEGCFRFRGKSTIIIQLWMTDRDIVERAHKLMGVTSCITTTLRAAPRKDGCFFQCTGEVAKEWMEVLLPLMGERRQAKIRECLDAWNSRTFIRRNIGVPAWLPGGRKKNPEYRRLYNIACKAVAA